MEFRDKFMQGEALRATLLDDCGRVVGGECAYAVSEGWAQSTLTPNVEAGTAIKQQNAAGRFLINKQTRRQLNWWDIEITFYEVAPELFSLLTNSPIILDGDDNPVGWGSDEDTFATGSFALEHWLNLGEDAACGPDGPCYGYSLLPWVVDGAVTGPVTITNAAVSFVVTGRTRRNSQWGIGPYDVVLDGTGQPSPLLAPIPPTRHYHQQRVCLPPPEIVPGCQELDLGS